MLRSFLTILPGISIALALSTISSATLDNSVICGAQLIEQTFTAANKLLTENVNHVSRDEAAVASNVVVDVLFHVISMDNTYQGGSLPDSVIQSQINVLSSAYNGSGVSFRLAGVDRTINGNWFTFGGNPNSPFMNQMKQALRRGSVQTLNVYSVGFAEESGGFLGYATFPWDFQQNPSVDGVVFAFSTTPGGSIVGLNQGKILVHEVGHWVGLLHTFEGGCAEPGDYVADTPAEASAARGCPTNRDTCPGGGVDPIQNHMDYTDDSCRQSFTDGQVSRFKKALNQFRGTSL